jgi:hypothetical protein
VKFYVDITYGENFIEYENGIFQSFKDEYPFLIGDITILRTEYWNIEPFSNKEDLFTWYKRGN